MYGALVNLALDRYEERPENYDMKRFPVHMLIGLLDLTGQVGSGSQGDETWSYRKCDKAAEAIQELTGVAFGYGERDPVPKKDAAIEKIRAWWRKRQSAAPESPTGASDR